MTYQKVAFVVAALLLNQNASGDIIEVSPLDFGTIVISQNSIASQINVGFNGIIGYSHGMYGVSEATPGEYLLSNFPASQPLFITATSLQTTTNSDITSSDQFTLESVNVPSVLTTDASGNATLYVGGTLQTSADGSNNYVNTRYTIRYQISVNY